MIDVLIRVHNEAEWIPQVLKSLTCQEGVDLGHVLIVDNKSNDMPEIYFDRFRDLNISMRRFEGDYLPGKVLNFGIRKLLELKTTSRYLLIISAHCFLKNPNDLYHMVACLNDTDDCRAAFGRQVPMTISDAQAVRDLALLYPKESRIIQQAAAFNNAFSLIDYRALSDNLFDPRATNLEDVIWAQKELMSGYVIRYCADAEAVHYHGPNHKNHFERLKSTHATIEKYSDVFNSEPSDPRIDLNDINPIFITKGLCGSAERVGKAMVSFAEKTKVYLWADSGDPLTELAEATENIEVLIRPPQELWEGTSLFSHFPELWAAVRYKSLTPEYIILYDGSMNAEYELVTPEIAVEEIKKQFCPAIWPAKLNTNLIFREGEDGGLVADSVLHRGGFEKIFYYEVMRGNGTIISLKYLNRVSKLFSNPGFYLLGSYS